MTIEAMIVGMTISMMIIIAVVGVTIAMDMLIAIVMVTETIMTEILTGTLLREIVLQYTRPETIIEIGKNCF